MGALPVAKCINSECNVALKSKADVDCSKATCQADCECSLQQCASEIDACLAAPNCAASQDCALACPCSDNACMLKCAASSQMRQFQVRQRVCVCLSRCAVSFSVWRVRLPWSHQRDTFGSFSHEVLRDL